MPDAIASTGVTKRSKRHYELERGGGVGGRDEWVYAWGTPIYEGRGCTSETLKRTPRGTKVTFCEGGLKLFSPQRGTKATIWVMSDRNNRSTHSVALSELIKSHSCCLVFYPKQQPCRLFPQCRVRVRTLNIDGNLKQIATSTKIMFSHRWSVKHGNLLTRCTEVQIFWG